MPAREASCGHSIQVLFTKDPKPSSGHELWLVENDFQSCTTLLLLRLQSDRTHRARLLVRSCPHPRQSVRRCRSCLEIAISQRIKHLGHSSGERITLRERLPHVVGCDAHRLRSESRMQTPRPRSRRSSPHTYLSLSGQVLSVGHNEWLGISAPDRHCTPPKRSR